MDLNPDPMDLMDLDLDLDPIHPSLTLGPAPVVDFKCLPFDIVNCTPIIEPINEI